MSARDVQTLELPARHRPVKAKDWDGSNVLGPCLVTADEFDAYDARPDRAGQRGALGRGPHSSMHHPFEDSSSTPRRAQALRRARSSARAQPPAARASSSTAGSTRRRDRDRIEGIGVLKTESDHGRPEQDHLKARPPEKENVMASVVAPILEGQGRRGEARRGDHRQDDAPLTPKRVTPSTRRRCPRRYPVLLPLRAVRRRKPATRPTRPATTSRSVFGSSCSTSRTSVKTTRRSTPEPMPMTETRLLLLRHGEAARTAATYP